MADEPLARRRSRRQTANGMLSPRRAGAAHGRGRRSGRRAGEFSSAQGPGGVGSHGASQSSLARRTSDQAGASRAPVRPQQHRPVGQDGGPSGRAAPHSIITAAIEQQHVHGGPGRRGGHPLAEHQQSVGLGEAGQRVRPTGERLHRVAAAAPLGDVRGPELAQPARRRDGLQQVCLHAGPEHRLGAGQQLDHRPGQHLEADQRGAGLAGQADDRHLLAADRAEAERRARVERHVGERRRRPGRRRAGTGSGAPCRPARCRCRRW